MSGVQKDNVTEPLMSLIGVSPDQTHVTLVPVAQTLSVQRTDKETQFALVCQDTSLSLTPSQVSIKDLVTVGLLTFKYHRLHQD